MALSKRSVYLILALILLLSALLRFPDLGRNSLWNDELYHWRLSHNATPSHIINEVIAEDVHPPLDHIMLWAVVKISDSETALRMPSAIFGVLAVFAMFILAKRLYSRETALLASALTAVLHFTIYYSQEARPYSLLFLLAIVTTHLWINITENWLKRSAIPKKILIAYFITALIASYLHYFGLYLIALQGLYSAYLAIRHKIFPRSVFFSYIFLVISYLPWIGPMLKHLSAGPVYIKTPGLHFMLFFLGTALNRSKIMLLIGLILILVFLIYFFKDKLWKTSPEKPLSYDLLLILWLFAPYIFIAIKSIFSVPVLTYRNLIISVPPLILIMSRSVFIGNYNKLIKASLAIVIPLVFLLHLVFAMGYYAKPQKEQFRESVEYILSNKQESNTPIIAFAWEKEFFHYYFRSFGSQRKVDYLLGESADTTKLIDILKSNPSGRFWYIFAHRIPDPGFLSYLNSRMIVVESAEFLKAGVLLLKKREKESL